MHNPFDPGYYSSKELRGFGFASIGENVEIAKNCTIIGLDRISIGSNVRIDGYCTIIAVGGYVRIGSHVSIGAYTSIGGRGGVDLQDFVGLSQGTRIYSASDDFSGRYMTGHVVPTRFTKAKVAQVSFGRHVVSGSGVVVLPGARIGEGAGLGALSFVTHSVRPWAIVSGSPARQIGTRKRDLLELEKRLRDHGATKPWPESLEMLMAARASASTVIPPVGATIAAA